MYTDIFHGVMSIDMITRLVKNCINASHFRISLLLYSTCVHFTMLNCNRVIDLYMYISRTNISTCPAALGNYFMHRASIFLIVTRPKIIFTVVIFQMCIYWSTLRYLCFT